MLTKFVFAAALMVASITAAQAENHEIKMLNQGADGAMVYEPAFLAIEPGDTVTFVPTDKGHNAQTIEGMLPDGAEAFRSKINEELTVTFDTEGLYGVKCLPHYALGMVALIQVGSATNLEEAMAVNHRGRAKQRFAPLFEQVEQ